MRVLKASVVLLLVLLLTACASAPPEQKDNVQQPEEKPEVTVDKEEAEVPAAESVIHYVVNTVMHGDTRKTEDDMILFSYAVEVPELTAWREDGTRITEAATPEEEKALQAVQTFHDRFTVWYAEETMAELEKTAREDFNFSKEAGIDWFMGYQLELNCSVYQTEKLVSVSAVYGAYTGGAHPNAYLLGWTFDLENGTFYGPEGMAGQTQLQEAVSEEIIRQAADRAAGEGMKPEEFFWPEYESIIAEWPNYAVSFDENGMNVAFSPYELAAYAAGAQTFHMSYEWLAPYLDEHGLDVLGLN